MQKDFHYYLIFALAKDAGYADKQCETIAYASQYVDDCNEHQQIEYKEKHGSKEEKKYTDFDNHVHVNRQIFRSIITQTASLKTFTDELQSYVLIPFHFIPGDDKRGDARKDGKVNRYSTIPANRSVIAQKILDEALGSDDLYRIGIALHAVVDTWSHQNFSGMHDDWNSVYPWYSPYSIAPNIGHAEVSQQPDTISDEWTDKRKKKNRKIRNRKRALEAAKFVYQKLLKHIEPKADETARWAALEAHYKDLIYGPMGKRNEYDYDERIRAIKKYCNKPNLRYNRHTWLNKAVKYDQNKDRFFAHSQANFAKTDFWQFQIAAQKQVALVWDCMSGCGL